MALFAKVVGFPILKSRKRPGGDHGSEIRLNWPQQLRTLTGRQRLQVEHLLDEAKPAENACRWINQRAQEVLACPHCMNVHVQRWGKESYLQRYRYGACHRTFNALTGSPLAGLA